MPVVTQTSDRLDLEENTDSYLLEDSSGVILLEGGQVIGNDPLPMPVRRQHSGFVQPVANLLMTTLAVTATLVARDPLYSPRPQVKAVQQPLYTANLLENTLGQVQQNPFKPYLVDLPVAIKRQPQDTNYLNLVVLPQPDARPFDFSLPVRRSFVPQDTSRNWSEPQVQAQAPFTPNVQPDRPKAVLGQQPTQVQNLLTTTLTQQQAPLKPYIFEMPRVQTRAPQDTKILNILVLPQPVARPVDLGVPIQPRRIPQNTVSQDLLTTTLTPAGMPPKSMTLANPIVRPVINRFDVRDGVLQLLTFVAPQLPKNFYDWQLPKPVRLPTGRLDTYQGQNPDLIPAPVRPEGTNNRRRRKYYVFIEGQHPF